MVDVVLEMEKPRAEEFRTLRVAKNRFGPTNQIAVFRMAGGGLDEVADPSAAFLSTQWRERVAAEQARAGLASAIALEGGQPFLVQVEALVGARKMAPGRRAALGVSRSRLELLIAVLEKTLSVDLGFTDVYVSLLGGITVRDTGVDLAILMALGSASLGFPVPTRCVYLGEVSLSGDVLSPKDMDLRVRQAKSLGFTQVSHPQNGLLHLRDFFSGVRAAGGGRSARAVAAPATNDKSEVPT
jgi:DNA repair protein RadA/Sms